MKDTDCRNGSHTEDATDGPTTTTTTDILTNGQVFSFLVMRKSTYATVRLIQK